MSFSSTYNYRERPIFDLKTLIEAIRFLMVNVALSFILLFLILEEFDWALFSYREKIKDRVVDNTSWNIKTLF